MLKSIIERISRGDFWDFHGGIHPPEQKELTTDKPIRPLSLPPQLIIPLQQHIGREGDLLVKVGDEVLKGQALTLSTNPMVVPIHAPTSGKITAIKPAVIAHPSGLSQLCIFLDVDGKDTWRQRNICTDIDTLSNFEIIEKIANAGISGMGGAGFPTHIKVNSKPDINFLIINGAECEPYITSDDLLMLEHSDDIVEGIKILDKLLNPAFILIAVEDNKPKAIKALQKASAGIEKIHVCIIPTKYPAGGEKQLIQILTGQEIPSGDLAVNSGIVMHNVGTCFAINEAVRSDTPLIRRVVTVTGQALEKPQNVWALLGTPISFLLEQCVLNANEMQKQPVIMGGPMMGFSVSNKMVPIVKTSNCILVPSLKEMPSAFEHENQEVECIRCGQCSDVCPSQLLPQELQWSAKAKDYPQLEELNLRDCIDCGACAYVCPSQIPLVHYYRVAKAEIREQQQLDLKADKAKLRFEARKVRLEKEKIARQEKQKKAADARKAAMNSSTKEASGAKSAVAAALARVKAKKSGSTSNTTASGTSSSEVIKAENPSSQVAAAVARAKAKKKQKEQALAADSNLPSADVPDDNAAEESNNSTSGKKAKLAAAVAKAKARAQAKKDQTSTDSVPSVKTEVKPKTEVTENEKSQAEPSDKKAKVAAAVAKAKARAQAKKDQASTDSEPSVKSEVKSKSNNEQKNETITESKAEVIASKQSQAEPSDKKAKVAAAVAKAKARAQAKKNKNLAANIENSSTKQIDEST